MSICTAVIGTPRITRCDANVCRSVCHPIRRNLAFLQTFASLPDKRKQLNGRSSASRN